MSFASPNISSQSWTAHLLRINSMCQKDSTDHQTKPSESKSTSDEKVYFEDLRKNFSVKKF